MLRIRPRTIVAVASASGIGYFYEGPAPLVSKWPPSEQQKLTLSEYPSTIYHTLRFVFPSRVCLCDSKSQLTKSMCTSIRPIDDQEKTIEIISRYKKYIASSDLSEIIKLKKEKNGVKIYTIPEGSIPDPARRTGLPVSRIGEIVIAAPPDHIADLWWRFSARKEWDTQNTLASELVEEYGPNTRMVYIKGANKPMVSSRDFVFIAHKIPAADVGTSYGSHVFVQTNAATAIPPDSGAVRGNINSCILIEPIDNMHTRVRYIAEVEPKGWLPTMAVEAAADDLPAVLGVIKQHLDSIMQEAGEKGYFERTQEDPLGPTLITSVTATKDELQELAKILRERLSQIKKDERQMGVKLTDLRNKVGEDLRKVEQKLKSFR